MFHELVSLPTLKDWKGGGGGGAQTPLEFK